MHPTGIPSSLPGALPASVCAMGGCGAMTGGFGSLFAQTPILSAAAEVSPLPFWPWITQWQLPVSDYAHRVFPP
jgi:hypothetical protein